MIVENERAMAEIERKIAIGDNRRELVEQYANVDHLTREMVEHQLVKNDPIKREEPVTPYGTTGRL